MKAIIGFGDFLLRLSPPGYLRLVQTNAFETYYTGAEANVCASLAVMGERTSFVTRLPDNPLGTAALSELRRLGVDVSHVVRGGDRLGLFYLEKGASQRPSQCVYDRWNSGFTTARRTDFDWSTILRDADWLHFSGTTPALGGELPQIVEDACRAAKERGLRISCDLNYRSRLWTAAEAARTMPALIQCVDVLIANAWDVENILGVNLDGCEGEADMARHVQFVYPNVGVLAWARRTSPSASDNTYGATLFRNGRIARSRDYAMHLVDRVGGGDAFTAGLLHALRHGCPDEEAVEFAAAAACLKHSIEKDVNLSTVQEIRQLMTGDGSGRIKR